MSGLNIFGDAIAPEELVFSALARAEDRVSRLDERVRASGFTDGWSGRADIRATLGVVTAHGGLVHPEDLLVHDLQADVRAPDAGLANARRILQQRRKARSGGEELMRWVGLAWLAGLTTRSPPPGSRPAHAATAAGGYPGLCAYFDRLAAGHTETQRGAVEDCLAVFDIQGLPALLQAAAFAEAWRLVDPLPREPALGQLAAAIWLKACGRFSCGLFPMEVALRRRGPPPRLEWAPLHDRLQFWLEQQAFAADLELEELTRLAHQRDLIVRRAAGGRSSGRAHDLADLAVELPVLTTEIISRRLGVTPQASLQLVHRYSGLLQEITGRSRYRVWRL